MGSEQSTQNPAQQQQQQLPQRQSSFIQTTSRSGGNIRRQHTIANPGNSGNSANSGGGGFDGSLTDPENSRAGSISPGPSVCSDSDLPYISYTVNRPIGDSPKLPNKQSLKNKSASNSSRKLAIVQKNIKKPAHNIVVVNKPIVPGPNDKDPEILRLQNIPMFLPIMRGTLNLPAVRDPEILERLDPLPMHNLCVRYQSHLTTCANLIATEQNTLTQRVRETDQEITRLMNTAVDRQKKFAKYAEKLSKVQELSHYLNRCHMILNQTLESMETLNNCLDIDDRLEPFVWTTG